ncbi:Endopolyphosphatase, partial [Clydaea vesicula]
NNLALQYILESLTPYGKKHINIPIIPSIGNNDVYPHNSLLWIDHKRPGKNKRNSVLEFYAALWDIFIPHSQMKTFKRGGYFFVEISEKLVIVSLNTMYWFEKNVFVGDCKKKERTAGGVHLTWLEKEVLIPARKSGKKVLLSGHIAPSSPLNFFPKCLKWYTVLTYEYNDVIIGQVYGHNNIDHFFFPLTKKDYSLNIRSSTPVSDYFFLGNDVDPFSTLSFQDTSNEYTIDSVLDNHNNKPHKPCFPDCGAGWIPEYIEFLLRHYKEISKEKTVLKPIFVSPSVVPAFNPALRVFYYNNINTVKDEKKSVDFQILYYDQYFVNLTYWNSLSQSKLESLLGYEKHKRSWRKRTGGDHLFEIEYRSSESFKTSVEIDNPGYWKKFGERLGGASGSENKKQVLELRKMWLHFLTVGLIAEEEKEK